MARTYTDTERSDAVALYVEHGLAEAHRRTDVPKPTLRSWATKAGLDISELSARTAHKTAAASEATRRRWETLRTTMADRSGDLAARVLDLVAEHLDQLTPETAADVKNLATAAGILIDKAQLLDGHATSRTEATISDQRAVVTAAEDQGLRLVGNG